MGGGAAGATGARWPRGARWPANAPAAAVVAVLIALTMPPPVASARPRAQATATPHGTSPAPIVGALPLCQGVLSSAPSAARLTVGDAFTVTTRARIRCPRLLEARGAVLVVGSVPRGIESTAGASLGRIVEALAATGTSRVAVIDVAAPDAPVTWAATPDALAAAAARLRALTASGEPASSQWLTALDAADGALLTLPPTLRPLLVVLDGSDRVENPAAAIATLVAVVGRNHDATGHSVLIALSPDCWLAAVPLQDIIARSQLVLVHATVRSGVERVLLAVEQALAMFQAPLSDVQLLYASFKSHLAPTSADPPATWIRAHDAGFDVTWDFAASGFEAEVVVSATLAARSPTRGDNIVVAANLGRVGAPQQSSVLAIVPYCIDPPPPAPPLCGAGATPTPVLLPPHPLPTPEPPSPTSLRPAPPPDRAPLFLPLAQRLR